MSGSAGGTSKRFELREHTADVGIDATADSLGDAFAAIADGLAAAQCDEIPDEGERFDFEVRSEGREALLFDFLDEVIYQRDVRGVLPTEFDVAVEQSGEEWVLTGSALGVPLEAVAAREIKAVTYADMVIEETDDGWHVYVVFDV